MKLSETTHYLLVWSTTGPKKSFWSKFWIAGIRTGASSPVPAHSAHQSKYYPFANVGSQEQQQAMEENINGPTQCTLTAAKQYTSILRTVHVLWRTIVLSSVHFSSKYNYEHLFALMIKTGYAVSSQLIARFMASSSKDRTILMLSLLERGVTRTRRRRSMPW
jgi:hypothetical protein